MMRSYGEADGAAGHEGHERQLGAHLERTTLCGDLNHKVALQELSATFQITKMGGNTIGLTNGMKKATNRLQRRGRQCPRQERGGGGQGSPRAPRSLNENYHQYTSLIKENIDITLPRKVEVESTMTVSSNFRSPSTTKCACFKRTASVMMESPVIWKRPGPHVPP